jgi:flagellar biosynthetic protein FliR
MSDYIIIGFRIILPIFASILLLNAVLGIMAKVSPQMNMFAIGMQLKIIVGLSVIFFTVGMLPDAADFLFTEMKKMMVSFIGGLS